MVAAATMPLASRAIAQSNTSLSNTQLSRETENPVTLLMALPLLHDREVDDGPYHATKSSYEIEQRDMAGSGDSDTHLHTIAGAPGAFVCLISEIIQRT